MDIKAEWNKLEFVSRENNSFHKPYEKELEFMKLSNQVMKNMQENFSKKTPPEKARV